MSTIPGKFSFLKEYLVKIGFDTDAPSLSNAISGIGKVETGLEKLKKVADYSTKSFSLMATFIGTSISAISKMAIEVADADLEVERFARKMWTSEENARSFNDALETLGATYDDIFWMTPEEFNRFMDVKNLASSIQPPKELNESLKQIRFLVGEFQKFKMIATSSVRWISYYFLKYIGSDLESARLKVKSIEEWIIQKLPSITEKVAKFFYYIYGLGKSVYTLVKGLMEILFKLFDGIEGKAFGVAGAIGGLVLAFQLGPISLFIAALLYLLLLLDDYQTWQRGGKSVHGSWWEKLDEFINKLKGDGTLDSMKESLQGIVTSLNDIFSSLTSLLGLDTPFLKWNVDAKILRGTLWLVEKSLSGIAFALKVITGKATDDEVEKAKNIQMYGGAAGLSGNNLGKIARDYKNGTSQGSQYVSDRTNLGAGRGFLREYDASVSAKYGMLKNQNNNITETNNITINTSSNNPQAIANEVVNSIMKTRPNYTAFG